MSLHAQLESDLDERIVAAQEELRRLQGLRRQAPAQLRLAPLERPVRRPQADRTREHSILVGDICCALGDERDLRISAMSPGGEPTRSGKPARCGPPGLADICGLLAPHGQLFCLEVKTGKGVQSSVQIAMMRIVRGLGGFYAVVHSVPDAQAALARARMGMTS